MIHQATSFFDEGFSSAIFQWGEEDENRIQQNDKVVLLLHATWPDATTETKVIQENWWL